MHLEYRLVAATADQCDTPCAVVGVYEHGVLSPAAAAIDAASGGALQRLVASGDLSGRVGSHLWLYNLAGIKAPRVLLVGLGKQEHFGAADYDLAVRHAAGALAAAPIHAATSWLTELPVANRDAAWRVRSAVIGNDHAIYRFKLSGRKDGADAKPAAQLAELSLVGEAGLADAVAQGRGIAKGIAFARELGNNPPNICTPAWLAEQARQLAAEHAGVAVEVLEPEQLRALGANALLAVGEGSVNTPRLIVLRWNGGGEAKPYALVGKGVTFDSGGINIKPGPGMEEMKFDMCGAASVLGAFRAVVELQLPINLVTIVPAAENMPGGKSYRPSDVLTTLAGITVEVLNTDAEGRLILCDALAYAKRYEPQAIVDTATLTGACVIALGKHAHGLFSADDALAAELLAAGEQSLDRAWRLPLWPAYQAQLDSANADIANIGGKSAGAITAACFLSRFTDGMRWAHLDIAGTAWNEGRKGQATGRPVGLLVEWLIGKAGTRAA
ncbi:MAG TPA: leucyl aminopeptidase [Rhodanobacteraceae bacterium]|nr:leucyl aminopeptidase [Rhodanobacteraceae bacterium]